MSNDQYYGPLVIPMLKRKTPLKRKSAMRRVSKQRKAQLAIYSELKKHFLSQHPVCQMPITEDAPICFNRATQVHHMKGRSGNLLNDTNYWMAVCARCHDYIETHKNWAREEKVILY